jgi:hypothetical protein
MISRGLAHSLAILIVILAPCFVRCAGAADDTQLFRKVFLLYPQARKAITSLEISYTYKIIDANQSRRCVYRFDRGKRYQGSVAERGGDLALPIESAWDGQRAYNKGFVNTFNRSTDIKRFSENCPIPDSMLTDVTDQALGLLPVSAGRTYLFKSASTVKYQDHECVALRFSAPWNGGELVIFFGSDCGYWPVYYKLTDAKGVVWEEIQDCKFFHVNSYGNDLYYPIHVVLSVMPSGVDPSVQICDVDPDSIHINEPIDSRLFVMKPWPSDTIMNWDTGKTEPAADSAWSPVGKVGFPWSDFVQKMKDKPLPLGPRVAGGPIKVFNNPYPLYTENRDGEFSRYSWLLWGGLATILGSLCFRYWKQHKAQA